MVGHITAMGWGASVSNWLFRGTRKAKEHWIGERLGRAFRVEALGCKALSVV